MAIMWGIKHFIYPPSVYARFLNLPVVVTELEEMNFV